MPGHLHGRVALVFLPLHPQGSRGLCFFSSYSVYKAQLWPPKSASLPEETGARVPLLPSRQMPTTEVEASQPDLRDRG